MAISRFLGCLLCGSDQEKDSSGDGTLTPVIPVQYTIEGKTLNLSSTSNINSSTSTSLSSKPSFSITNDEKPKSSPPKDQHPPQNNLPRTNRALVVTSKGTYALIDHEFPTLAHSKEVIIRNVATGLNPIDFKSVDYNFCLPAFPWVTGREMAGVVVEVGEDVGDGDGDGLRVGDWVWTSTYYRDRRAGCFQQFVTVPSHTVLPLPPNLSFDEAACLGVAALTAAMTLWRWLEVPMPSSPSTFSPTPPSSIIEMEKEKEKEYLLIWGGSTVTGQFAIQIARKCGLEVIAVTSSKTRSLAENLGATVVVRDDKTEDEIVSKIQSIGGNNITRAIDLVGPHTANYCLKAFSRDGGKKCIFVPLAMISSKAEVPGNVRVETVEMKQFVLDEGNRGYGVELNRLVSEGGLVMPGLEVLGGGLESVVGGLERLRRGDMVGRKMVVRME